MLCVKLGLPWLKPSSIVCQTEAEGEEWSFQFVQSDCTTEVPCSGDLRKAVVKTRSRAAATDGGHCFFHANPRKAAELGRIGGRKNGRVPVETDPLPNLDKATAVRDAVARLIADVYSGKLNPRIAPGLAPLMHLQLRVIEKTDLEERVAKMEKLLKAPLDEVKIRIGNWNLLARNPGGESR